MAIELDGARTDAYGEPLGGETVAYCDSCRASIPLAEEAENEGLCNDCAHPEEDEC